MVLVRCSRSHRIASHPPAVVLSGCQCQMRLDWALEQVTFSAPTGAGAVHVAIVATQALQILIARTAVVRVRMRMVMAVAGRRVVQAVRVAAAVAHLARISALVSNCQLHNLYLDILFLFLFLFLFRFLFIFCSSVSCAPFPISISISIPISSPVVVLARCCLWLN